MALEPVLTKSIFPKEQNKTFKSGFIELRKGARAVLRLSVGPGARIA